MKKFLNATVNIVIFIICFLAGVLISELLPFWMGLLVILGCVTLYAIVLYVVYYIKDEMIN